MPFLFLKYLQPTHYFRLHTKAGLTIFPRIDALPESVKNYLQCDNNYQSVLATDYDLSWQAVKLGYIGDSEVYTSFESVSIQDNYRFIRKNFNQLWVFYVLIIRLLSFHNPVSEFKAWFKTKNVINSSDSDANIVYNEWDTFESSLINKQPEISVIIPTLNRYDHLKNVLEDFEKQDYSHFEVLIIDQSDNYNANFYSKFNLDIKLIRQKEKALWLARNTGIRKAKGSFIALSEDDVRIKSDWISSHLKCLDFFDAKVSAGVFYPEGKKIPKERSFFAIGSQFATGNAMLERDIFKSVGLFDRQFEKQRMGDGEFGLRLYLSGIKVVSNPIASCVDVKAGTGGLRELGSWDSFRPSSLLAARPVPSVLYYFRRYYGNGSARMALIRMIPLSIMPYQFKSNKVLMVIGLFISILLFPIICYQVFKSWYLATRKIRQGPLIETL